MHGSTRSRGFAVGRLALLLAAVAQLAVAFLAPAAEARADRGARAHVEEAGTRLHHAHAETMCPACGAQHLTSVPPSGAPSVPAARHALPLAATTTSGLPRCGTEANSPRAPPPSL